MLHDSTDTTATEATAETTVSLDHDLPSSTESIQVIYMSTVLIKQCIRGWLGLVCLC